MVKQTARPFVDQVKANGKTYFYFRKGGKRFRLPDNPDSPEFDEAYWLHRSGRAAITTKTTFSALIESYLASPSFRNLAPSTKANYRYTLDLIREKNGTKDFRKLRRRHVIEARDKYAATWRKANSMIDMLSILSRHAIDLEWIAANPALGVSKLKGGEYQPWPQWALDAFEREATGHALTAYHLAVGTGQRLGDLLRMEWSHFDSEGMSVVQGKTGARLWIAAPRKLLAHLDAVPRQGRYILARNLTEPLSKSQITKLVGRVRFKIGAREYVIHGWRYTAAVQLAEAGCSPNQIASVTGHKTLSMIQKYSQGADQRRLSRAAQDKRE